MEFSKMSLRKSGEDFVRGISREPGIAFAIERALQKMRGTQQMWMAILVLLE